MENNTVVNNNCWVACVDLLGFKKEISRFENRYDVVKLDRFVNVIYKGEILDILKCAEKDWNCGTCWASDTFVLYTPDDSIQSFDAISAATIHFCYKLIWNSFFVFTGALGTGQFYADKQRNIFLGSAFIDAYEYTKKQNWIGFVVTPRTEKKMSDIESTLKRYPHTSLYQYTRYNVPVKPRKVGGEEIEPLYAACIHRYYPLIRNAVVSKQLDAKNDKDYKKKYKVKYENTLKFIDETN